MTGLNQYAWPLVNLYGGLLNVHNWHVVSLKKNRLRLNRQNKPSAPLQYLDLKSKPFPAFGYVISPIFINYTRYFLPFWFHHLITPTGPHAFVQNILFLTLVRRFSPQKPILPRSVRRKNWGILLLSIVWNNSYCDGGPNGHRLLKRTKAAYGGLANFFKRVSRDQYKNNISSRAVHSDNV